MFRKPYLSRCNRTRFLGSAALVLGILIPGSLMTFSAKALQLQDGRSFFDHAPRLERSAASFMSTDTPSTYQFTVKVPENAGASLKALKITQDPDTNNVDFNVSESKAFIGDSFAGGPAVSLANIGGEMPKEDSDVTVVFDQPIAPGQTVTVSLPTDRNPSESGVYLFKVTAFPTGESSPGLILGYGRVNVYDSAR